jgi:hypothetical protein
MERSNSTDTIPRILREWLLAFTFISFEEPRNKELFGHRVELGSARLSKANDLLMVIEVDNLNDRARLWRIVGDCVIIMSSDRS